MANWLLIDVSNWAYKLIHTQGPPPRSSTLFRRWLEVMRTAVHPERIVFAFDSRHSFRKIVAPDYKAGRSEKPAGLEALLDRVRSLAIDEGHDIVQHDGFEADDCIATLARVAADQDRKSIICSTDKDLRQLLVAGSVVIARSVSVGKGIEYFNESDLIEQYGLRADQWIDYQTLVGDKTDNVEGCEGFGDKTARKFLLAVGSLDAHYGSEWKAKISDLQRIRLANFRTSGKLGVARELVTLRTDVPLPEGWEAVV